MPVRDVVPCLHCERRPARSRLGLCKVCHNIHGLRVLYRRRKGWTPEWEAHLRRLSLRARQRLPLFTEDTPPTPIPPRLFKKES